MTTLNRFTQKCTQIEEGKAPKKKKGMINTQFRTEKGEAGVHQVTFDVLLCELSGADQRFFTSNTYAHKPFINIYCFLKDVSENCSSL